jgi:hypothetical protein
VTFALFADGGVATVAVGKAAAVDMTHDHQLKMEAMVTMTVHSHHLELASVAFADRRLSSLLTTLLSLIVLLG